MGYFSDTQGKLIHSKWFDLVDIETHPRFGSISLKLASLKTDQINSNRKIADTFILNT